MTSISDSVIAAVIVVIPLVAISLNLEKLIRVFMRGEIKMRNDIKITVLHTKDVNVSVEDNRSKGDKQ